jgi:hypothetical protein
MRLRHHYLSLTKIICFMLPSFVISCQSAQNPEDILLPTLSPASEYVFIPIKRVVFDYYDKGKWRFITQEVEYVDENHIKSLSSLWIFEFMPIEIVVLDNPDINDPYTYAIENSDGISFRKTNIFLPFAETASSDDFDSQLPNCDAGEFRAIARIVSSLKFIGLPNWDQNNLDSQNPLRPWFSLGDVVCLRIIRS